MHAESDRRSPWRRFLVAVRRAEPLLALLISVAAVVIGLIALYVSERAAQSNEAVAQAQLFLELRQRYHEVDAKLFSLRAEYRSTQISKEFLEVADLYWR